MTTKKGGVKSPPAPSIVLESAFSDVQKLYKNYSHGSFSRSEVAHTLEMSATSGPFTQRLFSIKEYGLLEADGPSYKVSQLFLLLTSSDRGSEDFKKHALAAITKSPLLADMLNEFKEKLPPQEAVAKRLETQRRFVASKAKKVATVLEASLRFAGVLGTGNNILPVREEQLSKEEPHKDDQEPPVSPPAQYLKLQVALENGRTVTILYPPDMTSVEASKVAKVLAAIAD